MKTKILSCIALVFSVLSYAQSTVKGTVLEKGDHPVFGATAQLINGDVKKHALTDDSGNFVIEINKNGTYTLEIRYLGFTTYKSEIEITGANIDLKTIYLEEETTQLQAVEVTGRVRKDYNSDYSFSATKVAMKNMELPQSVSTITKELIKDRQAYQINDALKGVSGVTPVSFYNHFNIRGITQNEDGQIINGLRTRQYYFLQPITQNIERIEVVKGPGSVTFSSADPGGSINMVTKKPLKKSHREVNLGVGSFSTIRGGLDFTGPLNEEATLLYRLNVGIQQAKSFRDLVKNNAFLISPSFSYVPNDKTAINVEVTYKDNTGNLDRGQPVFGRAITSKKDLLSTPIATNIAATNDYARYKELMLTTTLSQKITDQIQFNAQYMKQTFNEDLAEHRYDGFIEDVNGNTIDNLVKLRYAERKQFTETDVLSTYFSYDLEFGENKSTFVVGYDYNRFDQPTGNGQNGARRYNPGETLDYNGVEILSPVAGFYDLSNPNNIIRNTQAYPLTTFAIPTQLLTTHGAYIQNVTKIGKMTLLLSLRREWFKDDYRYDSPDGKVYENNALIPRVGLSYELVKNFNVYGTYLEGFQPQANTALLMPITASNFFWSADSPSEYDPLESNLIEFGAKAKLFNGAVDASLALFQIKQENILVQQEDLNAPNGFVYQQRGKDKSQGLEIDFSGYILPELQASASYSYIDAIIEEDANIDLEGKRKEATPEHSANLWLKYDFSKVKTLNGFSIGAGLLYSGDKLGWYDRDIILPSYTVADAVIYYQPNNANLEFNFKISNVLNETYWTGAINASRLFPGTPRNFMFSTTYKF